VRNKPKWYSFLLVGLALLLTSSVVGCASAPERSTVESYLADTEAIINEATELSYEISNLYENVHQYSEGQIIAKCAIYGKEYDDLFSRLIALECPQECSKLREYTIDAITYAKQEVTEFGAAFATGDVEHLYKSESYYNKAQKAIALAAGEWDRLKGY